MKISFCVLSILFATIILGISQIANAQSDNFETFTSKEMKFSIHHPSSWEVDDQYEKPDDDLIPPHISFRQPDDRGGFTVGIEKNEPYLDTDTMTLKNTSIYLHAQQDIDFWFGSDRFELIRQNRVTVGVDGNPGYKIEYTLSCKDCKPSDPLFGDPDSYTFKIFTTVNGKFYTLEYSDDQLKVPETLPLANKMVESFGLVEAK